jgi:acyl-CoA synthetase (AMP-forming)/AMP-acid ligase II
MFSSLVELLRWRATQQPERRAYTYLIDGEIDGPHLTYAALDRQARAIAAALQRSTPRGERVLLLYPTGLEFIAAFFGCLYAGMIAVPLPPPNPAQPQRALPRLRTVTRDARPLVALTTTTLLAKVERLFAQAAELQQLYWQASDKIPDSLAEDWQAPLVTGHSLALLQYTSGSTVEPKGVMVSHGNILHNVACTQHAGALTGDDLFVSWLPVFHDMGLISGIIQPLYTGMPCVLMLPQSFLQRPVRWLQAISRYRATHSGGPNAAYDLCVRRVSAEQRAALDLSSWKAAFTGSEPVRADTLKRFAEAFVPCGFRTHALSPCYGLAEATLMVSGGPRHHEPVLYSVQATPLAQHRVVGITDPNQPTRMLVGCGEPMRDTDIVIAHPEERTTCRPDEVGEIWLSSPSVAQGYWNRSENTERTFKARLADTGAGPFLRTGDLGFMKDGQLFVTGRIKDLIIIEGRNHYPQDIELTVEHSHPSIRPGGCAAFAVEIDDGERLAIVAEVESLSRLVAFQKNGEAGVRRREPLDAGAITRAIRRAVAEEHDVRAHAVALIQPGSIPKTSSGKLQRYACRTAFLNGSLAMLLEGGNADAVSP